VSEVQRLWSWTTLASIGLGTGPALVNWVGKTVAEYAVDNIEAWQPLARADRAAAVKVLVDSRYRKSDKAKARGSELHAAAEMLALGQEPDVPIELVGYVEQYRKFLTEHQPAFVMSEAPVYNPSEYYAGTCDGVIDIAGKRCVFDIKTTEHGPDAERSRPPYPEIALQLCAYSRAEYVGVLSEQRYSQGRRYYLFDSDAQHEPFPKVDGGLAIVISPTDYRVIPVRIDATIWKVCGVVREAARWQLETSKGVFGPPISATVKEAA
jgi:hypothetical protein